MPRVSLAAIVLSLFVASVGLAESQQVFSRLHGSLQSVSEPGSRSRVSDLSTLLSSYVRKDTPDETVVDQVGQLLGDLASFAEITKNTERYESLQSVAGRLVAPIVGKTFSDCSAHAIRFSLGKNAREGLELSLTRSRPAKDGADGDRIGAREHDRMSFRPIWADNRSLVLELPRSVRERKSLPRARKLALLRVDWVEGALRVSRRIVLLNDGQLTSLEAERLEESSDGKCGEELAKEEAPAKQEPRPRWTVSKKSDEHLHFLSIDSPEGGRIVESLRSALDKSATILKADPRESLARRQAVRERLARLEAELIHARTVEEELKTRHDASEAWRDILERALSERVRRAAQAEERGKRLLDEADALRLAALKQHETTVKALDKEFGDSRDRYRKDLEAAEEEGILGSLAARRQAEERLVRREKTIDADKKAARDRLEADIKEVRRKFSEAVDVETERRQMVKEEGRLRPHHREAVERSTVDTRLLIEAISRGTSLARQQQELRVELRRLDGVVQQETKEALTSLGIGPPKAGETVHVLRRIDRDIPNQVPQVLVDAIPGGAYYELSFRSSDLSERRRAFIAVREGAPNREPLVAIVDPSASSVEAVKLSSFVRPNGGQERVSLDAFIDGLAAATGR